MQIPSCKPIVHGEKLNFFFTQFQEFHADYCKKYHADHPITQHYDQTHPIANAHSPSDRSEGSGVKGLYGSVILVLATFSVKMFIGYF